MELCVACRMRQIAAQVEPGGCSGGDGMLGGARGGGLNAAARCQQLHLRAAPAAHTPHPSRLMRRAGPAVEALEPGASLAGFVYALPHQNPQALCG